MLQPYLAWYQLISSYPTSCIAVGWRLDDPHPFPHTPPIPQGGGEVDGLWPWQWQGGWGETRNLEHMCIYIYTYIYKYMYIRVLVCPFSSRVLASGFLEFEREPRGGTIFLRLNERIGVPKWDISICKTSMARLSFPACARVACFWLWEMRDDSMYMYVNIRTWNWWEFKIRAKTSDFDACNYDAYHPRILETLICNL